MRRTRRRVLLRVVLAALLVGLAGVGLFVWNGLVLASRGEARVGTVDGASETTPIGDELDVLAWNLAKCFVYGSGRGFSEPSDVERRLDAIAAVIRSEDPDLVFLSEVILECTPCDVDQVRYLARATGLVHWAFGENYNVGLPFLRIVGGNAILSKVPLQPVANPDLIGRKPFYVTRNNRRVLWCSAEIAGESVLLGAMHTDSFDLANNLRQTEQILEFAQGRPTILAGDFNAEPSDSSLAALQASGRFVGAVEGPATFPSDAPARRIDYVFAPHSWRPLEARVLESGASDHLPVFASFAP